MAHCRGVVTADDVDAAAVRLRGIAALTPLHRSERLSSLTGADVWLKREDLQPVRSYKVRGAYNLLSQVDPGRLANGAVCASAGNHGQGVALAGARLGVRTRVYLPRTTPRQKRERIAALGGDLVEVHLVGDTYDEAATAALDDVSATGALWVPAFDAEQTIAGQGTVAREVVEQLGRAPELLVVPCGGGGLLAGSLTWTTERAPATRVVGVEPAGAASMRAALEAGRPVPLESLDGFVDGAAVRQVGALTYPVVAASGAQVVTADEGRLCTEMLALYQTEGIIAEPAGALATAALGEAVRPEPGSCVVCVVSGGNNDVSRYAEILERSLVHEGLKHYFLVEFPQEPGALRRFLDEVLGPDDDITRFEYVKRNNRETGPALVGVELADRDDLAGLLQRIAASPLRVEHLVPGSALYAFVS
ncbi:MAG TPA: threonine ammonia-lyase IlvA [Mycobacteriales bacterium]|nr:threonine ammonia-lyase IlvA [Mycobacteriales bacterium]